MIFFVAESSIYSISISIYSNVGNWRRTTRTTYLLILLRQRFFFLFIIIREVSSYTSCYALQVLLWRVTVAYYYYCNSKNSCPAPRFRLCNSHWNFLKLKTVQRITFFLHAFTLVTSRPEQNFAMLYYYVGGNKNEISKTQNMWWLISDYFF